MNTIDDDSITKKLFKECMRGQHENCEIATFENNGDGSFDELRCSCECHTEQ